MWNKNWTLRGWNAIGRTSGDRGAQMIGGADHGPSAMTQVRKIAFYALKRQICYSAHIVSKTVVFRTQASA